MRDLCTFMIVSRWILLRLRNVSDKRCRENQNTHFMFKNAFPEDRAVYEIIWKYMVDPDRPQMIIQHGACLCRARYLRLETHSEYITLTDFQQLLRQRASLSRYRYVILPVFVNLHWTTFVIGISHIFFTERNGTILHWAVSHLFPFEREKRYASYWECGIKFRAGSA
jgi:hypothetical protein